MAPSQQRSRPLNKVTFQQLFKPLKPITLSESASTRPSPLVQKINAITWSATGGLLATCTSANIRVWNPERANLKSSTELRNAHPKHGAAYGSVGVSGDTVEKVEFCPVQENLLASTAGDGMVRLWDVRTPTGSTGIGGKGTPKADCKVGDTGIFLTWHPDGQELLVGRKDDVIHSVDIRRTVLPDSTVGLEAIPTERLCKGKDVYYQMAFTNSGTEVLATTHEGSVHIFDYPSMQPLHSLVGHPSQTYTVQHSPAGSHIAVGAADSTISLWNTTTFFCERTLNAPSQLVSIKDVSFSFDGQFLVAGSGNEAREGLPGLNVYFVETGEVVATVETGNCPSWVRWHPGRYWVAYAGDAGGLKVLGVGSVL
jgi:THO complex subunit 3